MSPIDAASEPLTYAHIGATGFYSGRGSNNQPLAPTKTAFYEQSTRQDRFQEIFERQVATVSRQTVIEPQNPSGFGGASGWGALAPSNSKAAVTPKKEMKWVISMTGNQVQLSVNPNAG
jgi:hypothetical protein